MVIKETGRSKLFFNNGQPKFPLYWIEQSRRLTLWTKSAMTPVKKELIDLINQLPLRIPSQDLINLLNQKLSIVECSISFSLYSNAFTMLAARRKAQDKDSGEGTSHAPTTTTITPSRIVQDLRIVSPSPQVPQPTPLTVVPPTAQEKGKRKYFMGSATSGPYGSGSAENRSHKSYT
ncbi:hypothetical protein LR48_Vigan11g156400 [Vigna angularis]|uniref:Uncharacterized protein n=1 Tax=Phaseolus angularis TaxID=3914 RepID=A0A0L9VTY6_PHAAN|nr:hypothetical protein LR48_Vigan11g156400 [Vigna angularis]